MITTNTYASTPISMKKYGYEDVILECNNKSVQLAKKAAENKKVAVADAIYGKINPV